MDARIQKIAMGHFAQDVGPIPVQRLLNERFIADTETAPVLQRELSLAAASFLGYLDRKKR